MTAIFNEAPLRQGRPFWHYGKDVETVRQQFSRYLHREHMIGAYYQDQMVGLIMLGNAGRFGLTGQIISSLHHRDKGTNNALVAKAVEVCEKLGLESLVYLFWSEDSLSEFKRRCGFERTRGAALLRAADMEGPGGPAGRRPPGVEGDRAAAAEGLAEATQDVLVRAPRLRVGPYTVDTRRNFTCLA